MDAALRFPMIALPVAVVAMVATNATGSPFSDACTSGVSAQVARSAFPAMAAASAGLPNAWRSMVGESPSASK